MAEDDDKEENVWAVNADGTQNITDACKAIDGKMLYLSTDYVFDGQGTEPWKPDCKDYKPLNVYGQTILEGMLAVANTLEKYFIIRITRVFALNGKNSIKTMINVGTTNNEVRVVNDQIRIPTYCFDLAGCWWTCARRRSAVIAMPPTRTCIFPGMTSIVSSTGSIN